MASGAQESENIRNGMQCLKLTHQIFHLFPNRYGIGTTPWPVILQDLKVLYVYQFFLHIFDCSAQSLCKSVLQWVLDPQV